MVASVLVMLFKFRFISDMGRHLEWWVGSLLSAITAVFTCMGMVEVAKFLQLLCKTYRIHLEVHQVQVIYYLTFISGVYQDV